MSNIIAVILAKIVNPVIAVMFSVAFLVFMWGIFRFVAGDEGSEGHENGKRAMLGGLIGFFIMIGVYGILALIKNSLGL